MATRRNQAQWQKLVDQQSSSGLSAAAFCRNRNVGYPSFMAWRKRLLTSEPNKVAQPASGQFIELTPALRASDDELQHLITPSPPLSGGFSICEPLKAAAGSLRGPL